MTRNTHYKKVFSYLLLSFLLTPFTIAQQSLVQDYSSIISIPETKNIQATETHLYVLSEKEGMVVFRVYSDSLQWLYTSSGMQRRGDEISADIRFAYLFGGAKRLTVLEPTSVLGVYSATLLPATPLDATRLENNLYVALGAKGLGSLSLETPETVDSEIKYIGENEIDGAEVLDVESSISSKQLFVLTSHNNLVLFNSKENKLSYSKTFSLNAPASKLFIDGERIWVSTKSGDVHEITSNGLGRKVGTVKERITSILYWLDYTFVRTISGKVWVSKNREPLTIWKSDSDAGNFITKSIDRIWISENNSLTKVKVGNIGQTETNVTATSFGIQKIPNKILTYPNPLIMALELEGNYPSKDVEFTYRSTVTNALIQKQGFVWQPTPNQLGLNWFTIIASNSNGTTDSTRFTVDVRSFNSPPVFSPVRGSSIVVNEPFKLQFNATDPEKPTSQLIRYIGVDLPEGSKVEEKTGLFTWTPNERQVGENSFKVIASDELGAASSVEVTLNVLDISRGD